MKFSSTYWTRIVSSIARQLAFELERETTFLFPRAPSDRSASNGYVVVCSRLPSSFALNVLRVIIDLNMKMIMTDIVDPFARISFKLLKNSKCTLICKIMIHRK